MENLKNAITAEIEKRYAITAADFTKQTTDGREEHEPRAYRLIGRGWNAKPYIGTPEQIEKKIRAAVGKTKAAQMSKEMAKISAAEAAPDTLNNTIIIKVDWTRSRTWGYTAKASDNFGHVSDVASGCGYDKASTATAGVLNQILPILKRLYLAKDKEAAKANHEALGYGSGYGVLPYFEGGVGVSCHVDILKRLGYSVTWGNIDVIVISEK